MSNINFQKAIFEELYHLFQSVMHYTEMHRRYYDWGNTYRVAYNNMAIISHHWGNKLITQSFYYILRTTKENIVNYF